MVAARERVRFPPPFHFHFFRSSFYLAPLPTVWTPWAYRLHKPSSPRSQWKKPRHGQYAQFSLSWESRPNDKKCADILKRKHARRDSPHLWKTRTSLRSNWGLVWLWPLSIHHLALSRPQRTGSVDIRWENILRKMYKRTFRRIWRTRDCKDVCCGPHQMGGRPAEWTRLFRPVEWVGVRSYSYYRRGLIWNFMSSSYQPEFVRLIRPVLQNKCN